MAGMALLLSFKVGAPKVCDVVGSALWHIAPAFSHGVGWTGSAQTHPNAFLTVTFDDVSPLFQPLANSSGIFIAFHEGQKLISNPPLCPPSSPLLHNWVTPAETYKTDLLPLICAPTIRNKSWACQRKYGMMAPKWSTLITVKEIDWNCCSTITFIIFFRLEDFRGWRYANGLVFRFKMKWRVNMLIIV